VEDDPNSTIAPSAFETPSPILFFRPFRVGALLEGEDGLFVWSSRFFSSVNPPPPKIPPPPLFPPMRSRVPSHSLRPTTYSPCWLFSEILNLVSLFRSLLNSFVLPSSEGCPSFYKYLFPFESYSPRELSPPPATASARITPTPSPIFSPQVTYQYSGPVFPS